MTSMKNRKNIRGLQKIASTILAASFLFSSLISPFVLSLPTAQAASYSTTWTSESDFENNTAGNGETISTATIGYLVNSSSSPGDVTMGPAGAGSVTDNFANTYHL